MKNPRFPHKVCIQRPADDDPFSGVSGGTVIYDDVCRSYVRTNVSPSGLVLSSERVIAVPVKQTDWTEDSIPCVGDSVDIQKGAQREYGEITDVRPNNFGTDIIFEYVRN